MPTTAAAAPITQPSGITTTANGGAVLPTVPVSLNDPIDVSKLSGASSPIQLAQPHYPSLYPVSTLTSAYPALQEGPLGKAADSVSGQIATLTGQEANKGADTAALYQRYGFNPITDANGNITGDPGTADLQAKLTALQNEAQAIPLQLQNDSTGRGITAAGLQPVQTAALRNNSIEALQVSSAIAAKNGALTTAEHYINAALTQKYGPIEAEIKALQTNLQTILNSPGYSTEEKNMAAQQQDALNQRAAQLDLAKTNYTNTQQEVLKYAGVADAQTLAKMQQASTPTEVAQIAAKAGITQPQSGRYQQTTSTLTDAFGNQYQVSRIFDSVTGKYISAPPGMSVADLNAQAAQSNNGSTGPSNGASVTDPVSAAMQAIVGNESGGDYNAVSKQLPNGSRSYGKYQVLDSNIPSWTKQYYGQSLTPQQFLQNPQAQEAVAKGYIGDLWQKYGNIADVASVYFTGKPASQSGGATDPTTGTTAQEYIQKATEAFNKLTSGDSGSQSNGALSFKQYGLLANTNFNPTDTVDQLAQRYLDAYIKSGNIPTSSVLGRNLKPGAMAQVDQRARDLYQQATGNPLPNPEILKGYQKIINSNNELLNTLKTQTGTLTSNFGLNLQNIKASDLNGTGNNALNSFIDNVKQFWLGNPEAAQYTLQNATLSNEFSAILALRNAQGTTVHDKLESAGLIPKGASQDQQIAVFKTLMQEANNAESSFNAAQGTLWKQIDPLAQDPNNPLRAQYQNQQFVEQSLSKQGYHYEALLQEMQQQAPQGYVPALDAKSGKPMFATQQEINSGSYIAL